MCFLLVATPHSNFFQMAEEDQAAGITQLWKTFSIYGWMDGWSCVYFTIFSVLFLKLAYRQHKGARQSLAYRCCYYWCMARHRNTMASTNVDWWHHRSKDFSAQKPSSSFHLTTQQSKMKQVLLVVYETLHDFTPTYYSLAQFQLPICASVSLRMFFRDCRRPFCPPMHQA